MRWLSRILRRSEGEATPLSLYNTLSGENEVFSSLRARDVKMYNCGPTVYGKQHIGNLSMFVFTDVLRRTLEYNGYRVRQVINFTDVGHLVSDGDEGEDKMTKGLRREGMEVTVENMLTLGKTYAADFLSSLRALNIDTDRITFPYASEHIPEQIAMVQVLEEKGYAYRTSKGVYFDTAKFARYGLLGGVNLEGQKEGARVESEPEKHNPQDFNLWKLDERLGWDSPWGKGFPGWHLECSAMIHSILGEPIDIHTGGIEHIPIHHNNEIAQTEAATGKHLARYWMHRAHLQIDGGKIAKSTGNTVYLDDITGSGTDPLAFRYLLLGAHYRTSANFTSEALSGAAAALQRLRKAYDDAVNSAEAGSGASADPYLARFKERVNDDLDTPGALAVLWEMVRDESIAPQARAEALRSMDRVLGLNLEGAETGRRVSPKRLPKQVKALLAEREEARVQKDWARADTLRAEIEGMGYIVEDAKGDVRVYKK